MTLTEIENKLNKIGEDATPDELIELLKINNRLLDLLWRLDILIPKIKLNLLKREFSAILKDLGVENYP